jgi:large subunit ribosomal protein L6
MSRIGKRLITIPAGVQVTATDGMVSVQGPKGTLTRVLPRAVSVSVEGSDVSVAVLHPDNKKERSLWGTFGAHIKNMITGVSKGFERKLEINGVGYRVALQGKEVKFEIGYSHPVLFALPVGITASVEKNLITLSSIDKELVGQTAAEIRALRKPEPYKGKGIKYVEETIRRKAGKTAAKAAA